MSFTDRIEAGARLAELLTTRRADIEDRVAGTAAATAGIVVLGLPRGGVPVAEQVADTLVAPLDVILVRKLGVPSQPELAAGAIGEDGVRVLNNHIVRSAGLTDADLTRVEARERTELDRRAERFRAIRPRVDLEGATAVIVDDGIATGATARAACAVARRHGARRVVLATPVAPHGWEAGFHDVADLCLAVETPSPFGAVGQFYRDFSAVSDHEVDECLRRAMATEIARHTSEVSIEMSIPSGPAELGGWLTVPPGAQATVVFVHGSGSSRHSPRNRYVAAMLNVAGFATLLFDLLTPQEEALRSNVFDIDLLRDRLLGATEWLRQREPAACSRVGYFGASTGAAAALAASTEVGVDIGAVVSRGGRPDLAGPLLEQVSSPTLLIVGSHDQVVLDLNRQALAAMSGQARLAVVPGASHLFEEPGTLAEAAHLARDWFLDHLAADHR
jgi:putative phosphoribosyl transferase